MSEEQISRLSQVQPHDRFMARFILPLIPKRVTPNQVTVVRMLLAPLVLVVLVEQWYAVGVPLFLFVAFTDAIDGSLARVRKQVTEWGVLFDPIADKLLIGSVLFLIVLRYINFALGITLLAIEVGLIIGGWIRKTRGKIEASNVWGKTKMITEVAGITLLLIAVWSGTTLLIDVSTATLGLAVVFAIVSVFAKML